MDANQTATTTISTLKGSIQTSLDSLAVLGNPDQGLATEYETLKKDIDVFDAGRSKLESGAIYTKLSEFNTRFTDLEKKKSVYTDKQKSLTEATKSVMYTLTKHIVTAIGMILGAIIASHWFHTATLNGFLTDRGVYKLFYGFYGALLFPFSLLMGLFDPPKWRAPLIPIFEQGSEENPGWAEGVLGKLFVYATPTVEDKNTGQKILQVLSGIFLGFVLYLYATSVTKFEIPSFLKPPA